MSIQVKTNTDANDSDKTFTVPANRIWKFLYGHVNYAATGTAGLRQFRMEITDAAGGTIISSAHAGTTHAAGATHDYVLKQGVYRETAFVDNEMDLPIAGELFIPAGGTIRFYDTNAIDAAADDMIVGFVVDELSLSGH